MTKQIVKEFDCGCKVEKCERSHKLPLFVVVGQNTGISSNPFLAGVMPDEYMAILAYQEICPHKDNVKNKL